MFEPIKNTSIFIKNSHEHPLTEINKNLFFEVPESDFLELRKYTSIPINLSIFWKEIGYGFLTTSKNGDKHTLLDNRIMDPLSIADILAGESEQVSPDFILEPYQIPFFERFSEYFVCFDARDADKPKQPVYWIWDMQTPLADSIESFIYALFENPDFLNEI